MSSITASATTYSGNCGSNLTWTYDNETYTLTISGTGAMYNYYSSNDIPWYKYAHNIKNIVINEGVTTIGVMAFCRCEYVTDIPIPDSITLIGMGAFIGCTSLNPSIECNHNCYKGGISGFFWKIINFFNKLFGLNKVCECGVAHY